MENSEIQQRIINLGSVLVKELDLDPSVDILARWMAHYVAEQIVNAENATGECKIEAENNCFETILKLWQYRSSLPNGPRPFENFEPIFRVLSKLDPENPNPYYYSSSKYHSSEEDDSSEEPNEVQQWLDIAQGIDQAARVLIEFVFHQAAINATDEKTVSWLENAMGLPNNDDVSIIVQLAYPESENESEEIAEKQRKAKLEKLERRIKQFDAFVAFSKLVRENLIAEFETLT